MIDTDIDTEVAFIAIIPHLDMNALAAFGSAALSDND